MTKTNGCEEQLTLLQNAKRKGPIKGPGKGDVSHVHYI